MKKRLEARLKQKEDSLNQQYEREMTQTIGAANTPAAKIRRMAMMHKHQMEMQQFRYGMMLSNFMKMYCIKKMVQIFTGEILNIDMHKADVSDKKLVLVPG